MLFLYSLLYSVALFFVFPFEYRKRPRHVRRRWLTEKFGGLADLERSVAAERASPYSLRGEDIWGEEEQMGEGQGHDEAGAAAGDSASGPLMWLHAVSVGEVMASVPFLRALKEKHPELRVMVSTITDTGQQVARERLKTLAERVIYMPFDLPVFLNRAIRTHRPSILAVMETEIWPGAFRSMKSHGIPVLMLNGRISEKSFRGYRKIRPFMKRVLRNVDLVCVQDETYAHRVKDLGADNYKVAITGSFKFDINVKHDEIAWARALRGPVLIAGSTHRGEEGLIVDAFKKVGAEVPEAGLIVAPRHPERFDEVEELVRTAALPCLRRTELTGRETLKGAVVLLDTVGELSSLYRVADVAVMGGSFIDHGGQNPLEPAAFGVPVVCGPSMQNFPFVDELYREGAAVETDEHRLSEIILSLLGSPEKREEMGRKAREIVERNRGAVERTVKLVEPFVRERNYGTL
jgi:3-deoxy-D-manno-octulosonic-acid transferase